MHPLLIPRDAAGLFTALPFTPVHVVKSTGHRAYEDVSAVWHTNYKRYHPRINRINFIIICNVLGFAFGPQFYVHESCGVCNM